MQQQDVKELFQLTPSALIELFTLDGSTAGADSVLYHFYDGSNNNYKNVVFAGIEYTAFPIKFEEMSTDGKGTLPRPKISCANINGFISTLLMGNENLIGAQFTRLRVFVRSLDAVNFPNGLNPWGTPDPTAIVSNDVFYVNRKIAENADVVQFELVTPIEIDNVQLPRRQMLANSCTFNYRDAETCGYGTGIPISDKNGKVFGTGGYNFTLSDKGEWSSLTTYNTGDYVYRVSTLIQTSGSRVYYVCNTNGITGDTNKPGLSDYWIADACARCLRTCKLRYPTGSMRWGGFLGISSARYVGNG